MPEWLFIIIAGAVGGLVSTFLNEGGFMAPTTFIDARGHQRWHPGTAGDVVVGAVAGIVFWGLYTPDPRFDSPASVRPVVAALLAGLGGGRLLSGYLDRFLHQASLANAAEAIERTADTALVSETGDQGETEGNEHDE